MYYGGLPTPVALPCWMTLMMGVNLKVENPGLAPCAKIYAILKTVCVEGDGFVDEISSLEPSGERY